MSSSDLTNQLRLVLEKSPNAPSLSALLEYVDVFVKDRGNASNVDVISLQIEQDLQKVCDDVIDEVEISRGETDESFAPWSCSLSMKELSA